MKWLVVLALVVAVPAAADPIDKLFPYLDAKTPGAVVVLVNHGKVIARRAYGAADVELGVKMSAEQRFRIASISKQLTAVAILQLVDAGKLALDQPIHSYLPDAPAAWAPVTLAALLSHTSGLPSFVDAKDIADAANGAQTYGELRALLDKKPLHTRPGTEHAYNNWGYAVLAQVLERATGQPYCAYVTQHLLAPLNMIHTVCATGGAVVAGLVNGYDRAYGREWIRPRGVVLEAALVSAGGWVSTVDDLAAWTTALTSGKLLKPETFAKLYVATSVAQGTVPYSFGTRLRTEDGHALLLANGDLPGFHSEIAYDKDCDCAAISLFNWNAPYPFLTRRLLAIARGAPIHDPAPVKVSEAELARLVGTYRAGDHQPQRELVLDHGRLYCHDDGDPGRDALVPLGNNVFRYTIDDGNRLTFSGETLTFGDDEQVWHAAQQRVR